MKVFKASMIVATTCVARISRINAGETTVSTSMLRGRKVVRTRTVMDRHTSKYPEQSELISPSRSPPSSTWKNRETEANEDHNDHSHRHRQYDRFFTDHGHHQHNHHFDGHNEAEHEEHHHHHPLTSDSQNSQTESRRFSLLPISRSSDFNATIFDELHNAPFDIFEDISGHAWEDVGSFPVFSVPSWKDQTGVFTAFSKSAAPFRFENTQFLLQWEDILSMSHSGGRANQELIDFIGDNNFQARLIVGRSNRNGSGVNFLAFLVSYYQMGVSKRVMIPFSRIDNFFDDTSKRFFASAELLHQEMDVLHDVIDTHANMTESPMVLSFNTHTRNRQERLDSVETNRFRKMFQLLVRRSFLFSFGYADCLKNKPRRLRHCLDDVYLHVVKMETMVRGALDEVTVEEVVDINENFRTKVSDECELIQNQGGMDYAVGSCQEVGDLSSFVATQASLY